MKQSLPLLFFCLFITSLSFGQKESFDDLSNKLLCNSYVLGKTDSLTFIFLKNNFPYLTQEKPQDGWSMPPISIDAKTSTTSFIFKKHPFFNFKLKEGSLDFETIEIPQSTKFEMGAKLWLSFENEDDAILAFTEIIDNFKNVSVTNKVFVNDSLTVGRFTGYGKNNSTLKAEITLFKDFTNNIYKIHFQDWFIEK